MPPLDSLVARVRGEYCEMPGLQLTVSQACRLWQVDVSTCEMLLEELVREGFLDETDHGAYVAVPTTGKRTIDAFPTDQLKVGVHALGYVAATTQEAADDFFPGYARAVATVARERGWPPVTRADFDAQRAPSGALIVGNAEEVVEDRK